MGDDPPAHHGRLSVLQPAPFWSHAGDPPLAFRGWFAIFESYIRLIEMERGTLDDHVRNDLLFSLLGTEGIRQFSSHDLIQAIATATWNEFRTAIKEHFQQPVTKVRARLASANDVRVPMSQQANFFRLCVSSPLTVNILLRS